MSSQESIDFSADIKNALNNTNMCFISEGYSSESEHQMEEILNTAKMVGQHMESHMFIIDRSDTSLSRVSQIKETIEEELQKRNKNISFEVIANPDFLKA